MTEYKFLKVKSDQSEKKVTDLLNSYAKDGWKIISFHPTSDIELGSVGIFNKTEPWDVGYAFLLERTK